MFGGELTRSTFADLQASEDPAEQDKIMHSMLITPTGLVLMAADAPSSVELAPGSSHSVSLSGARPLGPTISRRRSHRAARAGTLGRQLRHVCRQVRRQLDGEHHQPLSDRSQEPSVTPTVACATALATVCAACYGALTV